MKTSSEISIFFDLFECVPLKTRKLSIVSQLDKCLKFKSPQGDKSDSILYKITPRNATLYKITPRNAINFGHLSD